MSSTSFANEIDFIMDLGRIDLFITTNKQHEIIGIKVEEEHNNFKPNIYKDYIFSEFEQKYNCNIQDIKITETQYNRWMYVMCKRTGEKQ